MKIKRTGLDQYAPGGDARVRMLCIGGPDAGKTRMSSFWPKPVIANCEAGLASVADRRVPYADVLNSRDMVQFLDDMEKVCRLPYRDREFQTIVVDTFDTFQRKVKDEYMRAHPEMSAFRGFDAWAYLDAKCQLVLTRLLNLDMNIIVNVHYKDKTIREGSGDNASERQELMLQLQGDVKDSIFNDFDLVGWLGTFWAPGPEGGDARVEKRGLTFKRTPERPFLKDRLNVTPPWMEVTFSETDYTNLFTRIVERLDDLQPTEDVRDVEPLDAKMAGDVVGPLQGGAVPPQAPAELPLSALDKPSLQAKAREWMARADEMGRADLKEKVRYASNTSKAELLGKMEATRDEFIAAWKEHKAKPAGEAKPTDETPPEAPSEPVSDAPDAPAVASTATEPEATPEPAPSAEPDTPAPDATPVAPEAPEEPSAPEPEAAPAAEPAAEAPPAAATPVATVPAATVDGVEQVDPATGELPATTADEAIAHAAAALDAEVVSDAPAAEVPTEAPTPSAESAGSPPTSAPAAPAAPSGTAGARRVPDHCQREGCETALAGENQDYVKISFVKFRTFLCNKDFTEAKAAGKVPWPLKSQAA